MGLTIHLKVKDTGGEPVVVQVLLAGDGYAMQGVQGVLPRVSPAIAPQCGIQSPDPPPSMALWQVATIGNACVEYTSGESKQLFEVFGCDSVKNMQNTVDRVRRRQVLKG